MMRVLFVAIALRAILEASPQAMPQSGDWPAYGRDPGANRYSPLDQINTKNVAKLQRAWTYHTRESGRSFESTPIFVDNVLYLSTHTQKVIALDPETGREIWRYDPKAPGRENRGVSYWPGNQENPPRILFGTGDGRLIALSAKTGIPVPAFGDNGVVNLRAGITDKFPKAAYAITSPPTIYRDLVIVGPATQEGPSHGPSGDPRAFDVRTGKERWRFTSCPSRAIRGARLGARRVGKTAPVRASGASPLSIRSGELCSFQLAIQPTAFTEQTAKEPISTRIP